MPRPSALAFRVALLPQSRTGLLRGVNLDVCSFPADSRNSIKTKQVLLIDWRIGFRHYGRTRQTRAQRCGIPEPAQRALCKKPAPRAALRKFLSESAKSFDARATPRCISEPRSRLPEPRKRSRLYTRCETRREPVKNKRARIATMDDEDFMACLDPD